MAQTTAVKLDHETKERLLMLAKVRERTPHWLMKKAIGEYLNREEEYERQKQEDMRRWETFQETGQCIDNQTVMSWIHSWGRDNEEPCPSK